MSLRLSPSNQNQLTGWSKLLLQVAFPYPNGQSPQPRGVLDHAKGGVSFVIIHYESHHLEDKP